MIDKYIKKRREKKRKNLGARNKKKKRLQAAMKRKRRGQGKIILKRRKWKNYRKGEVKAKVRFRKKM